MNYPMLEQVESAGREQLGRWARFLPSPGSCAIGATMAKFEEKLNEEKGILDRIIERFDNMGGWHPSLSKKIGW